jgi:hypothetical protein
MLNNYKIDGIENQTQVSPKLTNSFYYFNNTLGIEELGMSIIIIIIIILLGCGLCHSLTKLIRLISGQLINKQTPN